MDMKDYEPACGFNMPPCCFSVPDDDYLCYGNKCFNCAKYHQIPQDVYETFVGFCTEYNDYVDGDADACELIEEF